MNKFLASLVACALATPVTAQDFSAESDARPWNLYAEVPARFEAKVVDILCELTGDCAPACGAGTRQMGLLRSADNVLVLAMKNAQAAFSGAAVDLAPFCGQTVTVDGLLIDDPDLGAKNLYLVQKVKAGDADWVAMNTFTTDWAAKNPDATGEGPWFRRDPRITASIAQDGYLGLGLEADAAFIEDWFQ